MIIRYMNEFGSITQIDASKDIGCMRLAARIADLRNRGYSIRRVMERHIGRYGNIVTYARYSFEEEPDGV